MKRIDIHRFRHYATLLTLAFLVAFLALELLFSLRWRMEHDTPVLHYIAYMIDRHGFVPYRDIYEQSMPGAYLFHLIIGKTVGYSDLAFQVVSIAYTLATILATWLLLKPFGTIPGLTSATFFGLVYMSFGPKMILQRDYVGILPLIVALIIATREDLIPNRPLRIFLAGMAIGVAVSVKPQLGLCLPILILYEALKDSPSLASFSMAILRSSTIAGAGVLIICSIPVFWLWQNGGLPHFWDIFTNYLPLYLHVNGDHVVHLGADRWMYIFQNYVKFGGKLPLFFCMCGGFYYAFFIEQRPHQKKIAILLSMLCLVYNFYPILSGKFWDYHWIPFYYFACLWTGIFLCSPAQSHLNNRAFQEKLSRSSRQIRNSGILFSSAQLVFPLAFVVIALTTIRPANNFVLQLSRQSPEPLERVDQVTDILNLRMRPNDTVQPLDTVLGGIVQGMLTSDAQIATPFIYDYQFYHDVSNPYTQDLRKEFIQKLNSSQPEFIVEYLDRPIPSGPDTSSLFPELKQFIERSYKIIYQKNKIRIYIRN